MPNLLELKQHALGQVNGAMTAIKMYPEVPLTNTMKSINLSSNPIDLLLDFFKTTKGYDWIIETVSNYIAYGIPALEVATKAILLSNIQTILTCSIVPLINQNSIRNGVVFDINQIDLLNIFQYSPLSTSQGVGKYYYFDCDQFTTVDEVRYSEDLNAVLWYVKNHPNDRVVWKTKESRYISNNSQDNIGKKHTKDFGIVTFEYSDRPSGLKDYEGNSMSIQEPITNCLHCFVGCAEKFTTPAEQNIRDRIGIINQYLGSFDTFFKTLDNYKAEADSDYKEKVTHGKSLGAENQYFVDLKDIYESDLNRINNLKTKLTDRTSSESIPNSITVNVIGYDGVTINVPSEFAGTPILFGRPLCYTQLIAEKYTQLQNASQPGGTYPSTTDNYYYRHLLMEFNTDFVLNTKLFDEKVITARLIDTITGCLNLSVDLSIEERVIQAQLRDMVERIIESDDIVVSDCFFSFTNEQYDAMLQDSELRRMGINPNRTENPNSASGEEILEMLNTLSPDATQEEIQSVVKGMIFSAVSSTNPHTPDEIAYELNLNVIEKLLTQLVYIIVTVIVSPKVYILLMINLKLMGYDPNFDIKKFIEQFKQLITSLIREIRDNIIRFFLDEIMKILKEILFTLGIRLQLEQYEYYMDLLTHCLDCFRLHKNEYDWTQDYVNYADITDVSQIINQEC